MLVTNDELTHLKINVQGCVQGVGFRPFIFKLARSLSLYGTVYNSSYGCTIHVQGDKNQLNQFKNLIFKDVPIGAKISEFSIEELPCYPYDKFSIEASQHLGEKELSLLPDTAICPICLAEFQDPTNRRYQYPFIHCMQCGPRFSLFEAMPFDRQHTSMKDFPMCLACQKEYQDPQNRRFFSQTLCCSCCGPKLELFDAQKLKISSEIDILSYAKESLKMGKILALKNTGGFLLLADATNEECIQRLRIRKQRPSKPLALLLKDLESAHNIAFISPEEETLLSSSAAPIVICKKKLNHTIAPNVASESAYFGIMLPSTALLHSLALVGFPLVATSGNLSGGRLCASNQEACEHLSNVFDLLLSHNRRITASLDDSVAIVMNHQPVILRRARGYVPSVKKTPPGIHFPYPVVASGSHLKNTFAIAHKQNIYVSQHIGDLENFSSFNFLEKMSQFWYSLLQLSPKRAVCDNHPNTQDIFFTKSFSQQISTPHHRAHVLSAMLDSGLQPPFLAFTWDGTGIGDDHTIWGAETFLVNPDSLQRIASIMPFPLVGASQAVKESKRSCLGLLYSKYHQEMIHHFSQWCKNTFSYEELFNLLICLEKNINTTMTSSMGRLFDAVSSLLDLCHTNDFEGHAAIKLEQCAIASSPFPYSYLPKIQYTNHLWQLDAAKLLSDLYQDKLRGRSISSLAQAFHTTLANFITSVTLKTSCRNILLTGGVMQNKFLVEKIFQYGALHGIKVHMHTDYPPGDGGLSLGQIGLVAYPSFLK
ncbi:MAG: carbamoyltransferase HypF [Chlamydiae bacterium]|nr:carbamoyltransferase HypF [Chlamydiota bacterium]